MHRDLLRSIVVLVVVRALVGIAAPAPDPWRATSRPPPAGEFQQRSVPVPDDVTSPLGRRSASRANQPASPQLTGAAPPSPPDGAAPSNRRARTRRGKRSRVRGCRGGVRWRLPGRHPPNQIMVGQLNTQSLKPKLPDLRNELHSLYDFDILALSETWLSGNVPSRLLTVSGYQLHRFDRPRTSRLAKGHGGVAILSRDSYDVVVLPTPQPVAPSNLEVVWAAVRTSKHRQILIGSFYRHPTQTIKQIAADLDDLENQIQCMTARHKGILILCGDFNLNTFNLSPDSPGGKFRQLLSTYDLHLCNTSQPTYRPSGSLLDAIITNRSDIVNRSGVTRCHYSPHEYSRIIMSVPKSSRKRASITSRCIDRIQFDEFNATLLHAPWGGLFVQPTPLDKWHYFLSVFTPLLDSVAPVRVVKLRNPDAPTITTETARLMQQRRGALASGDRVTYKALNKQVRSTIRRDSREHIRQRISEVGRSGMWRCLRSVIGGKATSSAAPEVDPDTLNRYFVNVGATTAASVTGARNVTPVRLPRVMTCAFQVQPVTLEELCTTVCSMKASSSCVQLIASPIVVFPTLCNSYIFNPSLVCVQYPLAAFQLMPTFHHFSDITSHYWHSLSSLI